MQNAIGKEKNLKIALMGHSAGGHLALLYAYKNPTQIDLVISEAGPTYFYKENEDLTGQDDIITDENICAMVGIDYKGENYVYQHKNEEHLNYQEDLEDITALWNA